MGTIRTPRFRVEYRDQTGWHMASWETRQGPPWNGLGCPTDAKAEAWRVRMNKSYQLGGPNAHVAERLGFTPHVSHVRIIHQKSRRLVAATAMPMFEVV